MHEMRLRKAKSAVVLVFFFLKIISLAQCHELYTQIYPYPFTKNDSLTISSTDSAGINNGAIQVTPDTASNDLALTNRSGRAFHNHIFKMWENTSIGSRVVSFNTSFLINIYRTPANDTPGEGLAFLIAPDATNIPANSFGQYLGLTNSTIDGDSSNQFVAIEFDTYKQDFDPDNNHVGLDINGVHSVKTQSLTPYNMTLSPEGAAFYNVWVIYDGLNKTIEVYMAQQALKLGPTPPMPSSPLLRSDLDLSLYVNQYSYFGFSASTGNYSELNCVLAWNLSVEILSGSDHKRVIIAISVCVPVIVLSLLGVIWFGCYRNKKTTGRSRSSIKGTLKSLPGSPKEYDYKVLKRATNNFDEKNKLGQGGYGAVYYGLLLNEKTEVAVKCLLRESLKGQDDFLGELTIINRLRHRHLVRLLGWCYKNGHLLLVYEFMPKGSLDQHLFAGPEKPPLSWHHRFKIVTGVSSALHYLHNEYDHDKCVVHRDLKASNIMLSDDYSGSIGDFGLARVLDYENTSYIELSGIPGTIGYIAPECLHTGKTTQQSDVYAFGAVLLEVVCGLRPGTNVGGFNGLADWVWYLHRDGHVLDAVDPRLGEDYDAQEAERLLLLGLACSHPTANDRPKSRAIVQILSGAVPVPFVPPFKPAFIWPSTEGTPDLNITDTSSLNSQYTSEYSQKSRDSTGNYAL